jgi:hypothetical protein
MIRRLPGRQPSCARAARELRNGASTVLTQPGFGMLAGLPVPWKELPSKADRQIHMEIKIVLLLVWVHFFGDFVLQTNDMAAKKSKSALWLLFHTMVYSALLVIFGALFALVNFAMHLLVDFCTSRAGAYFNAQDNRKGFFMVLGTDQAIHLTTLIISYQYLGNFGWFLF